MDITTKELEYCKLAVSCVANVEEISSKKEEVLRLFQKAPVPGFRKGKTGMDAIKMHYRTQIEDSLKRAMAEDAYHNTLFEKKLRPYGAPQFNSLILEKNKFTCDFDIFVKSIEKFIVGYIIGVMDVDDGIVEKSGIWNQERLLEFFNKNPEALKRSEEISTKLNDLIKEFYGIDAHVKIELNIMLCE